MLDVHLPACSIYSFKIQLKKKDETRDSRCISMSIIIRIIIIITVIAIN